MQASTFLPRPIHVWEKDPSTTTVEASQGETSSKLSLYSNYQLFNTETKRQSKHWMTNSLLYAFLWVIPLLLNFICRRFGTRCLFHLHRHTTYRTRREFEIKTNSLLECLLFSKGILLRRPFSVSHEKKHWCHIQSMPKNESKRLKKCVS